MQITKQQGKQIKEIITNLKTKKEKRNFLFSLLGYSIPKKIKNNKNI